MQIEGKILEIFDKVDIKESFQKREFVIEYAENPNYPEYIKFETIQDRCALLDKFSVGDEVKIDFNLKGRKWTNREGKEVYFNSLQAWNINPVAAEAGQDRISDTPLPTAEDEYDAENELPF